MQQLQSQPSSSTSTFQVHLVEQFRMDPPVRGGSMVQQGVVAVTIFHLAPDSVGVCLGMPAQRGL